MYTPRSKLIRATERAIREYIEDNCERNLPLIQKLEDLSYNIWVESNTDFLLNDVLIDDADDEVEGYTWDDAFMPSSLTYDDDSLDEDVCEDVTFITDDSDVSSIGSSIRPCDESDCRIGYLAGSEDESDMDTYFTEHECIDSAYQSLSQTKIRSEENGSNDDELIGHEQSAVIDDQLTGIVSRCRLELNNDTEIESGKDIQQDWVILNSDFTEEDQTFDTHDITTRIASNEVEPNEPRNVHMSGNVRYGSEECSPNGSDLEEWSVLSMNITEHAYPRIRRRLFAADEEEVSETPRMSTNSDSDVLTYLDSWAGHSTRWLLFRLFLRILRYLLRKNR